MGSSWAVTCCSVVMGSLSFLLFLCVYWRSLARSMGCRISSPTPESGRKHPGRGPVDAFVSRTLFCFYPPYRLRPKHDPPPRTTRAAFLSRCVPLSARKGGLFLLRRVWGYGSGGSGTPSLGSRVTGARRRDGVGGEHTGRGSKAGVPGERRNWRRRLWRLLVVVHLAGGLRR